MEGDKSEGEKEKSANKEKRRKVEKERTAQRRGPRRAPNAEERCIKAHPLLPRGGGGEGTGPRFAPPGGGAVASPPAVASSPAA